MILHGYELDTDNSHGDVYGGNNKELCGTEIVGTSRRIGIAMRITDLPTSTQNRNDHLKTSTVQFEL